MRHRDISQRTMERKKKSGLSFSGFAAAAFAAVSASAALSAPERPPWPLTLRSHMVRLNDVGYRIGIAAASLCPSTAAGTGISLDYIGSYQEKDRPAIKMLLGLKDPPQVAAVAHDSPAELAGVKSGDDLIAVNGVTIDQLRASTTNMSLFADDLEQRIATIRIGGPIKLDLRRGGRNFAVQVVPKPVCASRFIIKTGLGITAFSDGTNVAVSSKLIGFSFNDDELALIAAHEVAHVINQDGKAGSLKERRQMEDRADALGVRLLHCAGYDVGKSVQFWLRRDAKDWVRMFRDPTHRSRKSRVELMRREAIDVSCPPAANLVMPAR